MRGRGTVCPTEQACAGRHAYTPDLLPPAASTVLFCLLADMASVSSLAASVDRRFLPSSRELAKTFVSRVRAHLFVTQNAQLWVHRSRLSRGGGVWARAAARAPARRNT